MPNPTIETCLDEVMQAIHEAAAKPIADNVTAALRGRLRPDFEAMLGSNPNAWEHDKKLVLAQAARVGEITRLFANGPSAQPICLGHLLAAFRIIDCPPASSREPRGRYCRRVSTQEIDDAFNVLLGALAKIGPPAGVPVAP